MYFKSSFLVSLLLAATFPLLSGAERDCGEEGNVLVYAKGADALDFGASDEEQCVSFCFPEAVIQFLPAVSVGGCISQGFGVLVESERSVQPPGSPSPLLVSIYKFDDQNSGEEEPLRGLGHDSNPAVYDEGPCVDCPEYVSLDA